MVYASVFTMERPDGPLIGIRHLQTLLLFFSIVLSFFTRLNVSIAVVAMTNANTTNPDFTEYAWDEKQKSYILSSFFWGYFVLQIPGAILARRFGAQATLLATTLISSFATVGTPLGVQLGDWYLYAIIRLVMGLAQGPMFACIHQHLAKWSPADERTMLGAMIHSGGPCGVVVATFASGFIAHSRLGWPGISYVSGGLSFVWCLLWALYAADHPNVCKLISAEERIYIETSLHHATDFHDLIIPIPWRAIFTSVPFLSLLVARSTYSWGFYTAQMQMPAYMRHVLHLDIRHNAVYSTLPFVVSWLMTYVYIVITGFVMNRNYCTLNVLRKSLNTFAFLMAAIGFITFGFLDKNHIELLIIIITITFGASSAGIFGSVLNNLDLSPNHAGMLMSIINVVAIIMAALSPLLVGIVVYDDTIRELWQVVFFITAFFLIFGSLVYIFFGSVKAQPWDEPDFLSPKI